MPASNAFDVEMAIEKLKSHKSPGIDQIPVELIKAGVRTIRYEIHSLFGIRRNGLRTGMSGSWYLFIRRAIKQIVVIIEAYHFCQIHSKLYPSSCCPG